MWRRWRRARLAAWLVGSVALSACGGAGLDHAAPTPQSLARAVGEAVAAGDVRRLHALAVDEDEFRQLLWPELPAARPERNVPVEYVWDDLQAKSRAALQHTLAARSGEPFELVGIRFAGGTSQYATYLVHRDAVLTVRAPDGLEDVRLFGSVLERNGRFKVFSYITD